MGEISHGITKKCLNHRTHQTTKKKPKKTLMIRLNENCNGGNSNVWGVAEMALGLIVTWGKKAAAVWDPMRPLDELT